ncbi:hypothetical protein BH10PSE9_BH10PSE9_08870 [soil metagenome]
MRPRILIAATALMVVAAAITSPADAKSKKNFFFIKNGAMHSFKAYKLYRNPPLYVALHKIFGIGTQFGPTMYIPIPSESSQQDSSAPASSSPPYDPCSDGWSGRGGA